MLLINTFKTVNFKQRQRSVLKRVFSINVVRNRCPWRENIRQMVKLGARRSFDVFDMLKYFFSQIVYLRRCIFVFHSFYREMNLLIKPITRVELVILWNLILNFNSQSHSCFICPTTRHILYCIASPTHHYCWQTKFQHVLQALRMSFDTHVELPKLIVAKTISSKLHYEGMRPIFSHNSTHDIFEQMIKVFVCNAWLERNVECKMFTIMFSNLVETTSSRKKVLAILMKRNRHATIRKIKSLFDSITMVYVNVKIKYSRIHLQQFQNGQNNVIYIAESASLRFFCMMQPASPVYGYVCLTVQKQASRIDRPSRRNLTKVVQSVESWTISRLSYFKSLSHLQEIHSLGLPRRVSKTINACSVELTDQILADILAQVSEIVFRMKTGHLFTCCLPSIVDIKMTVEASVHNKRVGHGYTFRFHGMVLRVDKLSKIGIVEIRYFSFAFQVHWSAIGNNNMILTRHNQLICNLIILYSWLLLIINYQKIMLIEIDKYQPNSLRRGRVDALQKDISDAYTLFDNKFSEPRIITINDFINFWTASQLRFIVYIRCQDQDEDQYFQAIDKILINQYFLKQGDSKKIFTILCLYFFSYSVDGNGDRNPRFIHVTTEFITSLTVFLRENTDYTKSLFVKAIKKIKELFVYSIKTGARDPLIKKNGQTHVRYPKPIKKLSKDNYSPTITEIKEMMPDLEQTIKSYHQQKQKYFRKFQKTDSSSTKKEMTLDKNITFRLNQILKAYDEEMTYVQDDLKNHQGIE